MVFFGLFEMVIGILCLIPSLMRIPMLMPSMHMVTTMMPLVLLPKVAWVHGFVPTPFVPTPEGQYIIKNLAIIAVAISIVARLCHPEDVHDLAVNPCTNDPIIGQKR